MSGLVLSGSENNMLLPKDESFQSLQDYQQQVQSEVETRAMLAKVLHEGIFCQIFISDKIRVWSFTYSCT